MLYVFLEPSNGLSKNDHFLRQGTEGVPTQERHYIVIFETIAFTEKFEGGLCIIPSPPNGIQNM